MADDPRRIVVVGGSVAAVEAGVTLRQLGFDGELMVLSEERHAPYTRVPLSKGVLAGTEQPGSTTVTGVNDALGLRLGVRAIGLDTVDRLVHVDGAAPVPYDRLVIATGARARRLSPDGFALRTLDDCAALRQRLEGANSVVVVGAGFLGMEIASTCRKLGVDVTVVDPQPPLVRLVGPVLAGLAVQAACEQGVQIVTAQVARIEREAVQLTDGRAVRGDLVVEAVGDLPNVEWLAGSGLDVRGGVVVDHRCVAAPGIVAAGDVAVTRAGVRTPHWTNALEQARAAATTALRGSDAPPYAPTPYYWTEQFGLVLRILGEVPPKGRPTPHKGGALLSWADAQGAVNTVATINNRAPISRLRGMLATSSPVLPHLASPSRPPGGGELVHQARLGADNQLDGPRS